MTTNDNERSCEVQIASNGKSIAVANMTREDAVAVYEECVRQYVQHEHWTPIDTHRVPPFLTKLHKGCEIVSIAMIDHSQQPQPPALAWLTRVPKAVQA